jgi:hypothetical protein
VSLLYEVRSPASSTSPSLRVSKPFYIVESADLQCIGRGKKTACIGPGHDGVAARPLASDARRSQPFSQLQRPSRSMSDAELRLPSTRVTPSCFTPFHLTQLLLLLAGKLLLLLPLLARTLPALSFLSHPSHPSHIISCVPSTSYMHPLITTARLVLSDYFDILVPRPPPPVDTSSHIPSALLDLPLFIDRLLHS